MNRLVLDRLWPMLVVLGVLIAGALALEGFAARRGNDPLVITIVGDEESLGEEGDAPGPTAAGSDAPASERPLRGDDQLLRAVWTRGK